MKCTKCRGQGKFLPPEGITKADLKLCNICKGSGEKPHDYIVKKKDTPLKTYLRKTDGLEDLKKIMKF